MENLYPEWLHKHGMLAADSGVKGSENSQKGLLNFEQDLDLLSTEQRLGMQCGSKH